MFKKIAIFVVIVIAAILIFAATKPDDIHVERSASIKAPPQKIFSLINDFQNWGFWSPWEKLDPNMKRTFSTNTVGKGASYAWEGDSKVGAGKMEIAESTEPSKILIKLDFTEPFEGHNISEFTLTPKGEATEVTWVMHGPANYLCKVMSVFVSMDQMIGKEFEKGLVNLKTLAEK